MRLSVVFTCVLPLIAFALSPVALAQHDPHRDAVRFIAAGQLDKAANELKQAGADEPETQFVQMLRSIEAGPVEQAVKHAQKGVAAGLPPARLIAGPRKALAPLYATDEFQQWIKQLGPMPLLHGPMLGSVTDTRAAFWVRTAEKSAIQVKVYDAQSQRSVSQTPVAQTTEATDFTAVVTASDLAPATNYRYDVLIDGQAVPAENSRFQTFPRLGQGAAFSVGFGGGAGYVPKWESMWDTIVQKQPLAFLMLGDNVYIDDPQHQLTQRYCYYRRQSRPEWRRLTASTNMAAIYDDHDFGTNDCVPGPKIDEPPWKRPVWRTFQQNWANPYYGGGESQPGCWCDFYIGDVHFILLDGRYYRTHRPQSSMLGPAQKAWLFDTLKRSRGTFKVLASPVPWSEGVKPGSRDPWDGFPEEREEIFSFLENERIDGVFLIAADRHRSDLRVAKRKNGYDLYEFESSRLTNRHTHGVVKTPGLIWGYNKTCSFGLMRFDTTQEDPQVEFEVIAIDGQRVHSHKLRLSEVTHGTPKD